MRHEDPAAILGQRAEVVAAAAERRRHALRPGGGVKAVQGCAALVARPDQAHGRDGRPRVDRLHPVRRRVESVSGGVHAERDKAHAVAGHVKTAVVVGEAAEHRLRAARPDPALELLAVEVSEVGRVEQPPVPGLARHEHLVVRKQGGSDGADVGVAGVQHAPAHRGVVRSPRVGLAERPRKLDDAIAVVPAGVGARIGSRAVAAGAVAGGHVQVAGRVHCDARRPPDPGGVHASRLRLIRMVLAAAGDGHADDGGVIRTAVAQPAAESHVHVAVAKRQRGALVLVLRADRQVDRKARHIGAVADVDGEHPILERRGRDEPDRVQDAGRRIDHRRAHDSDVARIERAEAARAGSAQRGAARARPHLRAVDGVERVNRVAHRGDVHAAVVRERFRVDGLVDGLVPVAERAADECGRTRVVSVASVVVVIRRPACGRYGLGPGGRGGLRLGAHRGDRKSQSKNPRERYAVGCQTNSQEVPTLDRLVRVTTIDCRRAGASIGLRRG